MGAAPKPDAERRRKNTPTFGWTILPAAGREGDPPPMPAIPAWLEVECGDWPASTVQAWSQLWCKPQATAWDQSGSTLRHWVVLHAKDIALGINASERAEMRQIEDRHGLNPKALLQLRWRIDDSVTSAAPTPPTRERPAEKARRKPRADDPRLKVIDGGRATRSTKSTRARPGS
jgi:hypothetical protein